MDVVIDAGMAGCAAAAPLLLAASCSWASSCPLLVADGCMTGPASSSARLVEAEAVACASCSMTRCCWLQQTCEIRLECDVTGLGH